MSVKNLFFIDFTVCLFAIGSCQPASNKQKKSTVSVQQEKVFHYTSDDGKWRFLMRFNPEIENGIILTDQKRDTTYYLQRVIAASGVRYADSANHVFWTKGQTFMWMKNNELITSGKIIPEEQTPER
ncbi:MAG: MliC family protein [Draconibacterium sp.]